MGHFNGVIWVSILISFAHGIVGVDHTEDCKRIDGEHLTKGNFTCCASSPRKVPLVPSLDFVEGWKKCALEPESSSEDPVISAWRVYRCIVFRGIPGKPLLPTTYTSLMAAKYPALIQTHILHQMSTLEDQNMKFESYSVKDNLKYNFYANILPRSFTRFYWNTKEPILKRTPYPKVHLLRNIFYDIEQEICESEVEELDLSEAVESSRIFRTSSSKPSSANGNAKKESFMKTWTPTSLAQILCETCDRSKAIYHRNADCCSHVPLPFPFLNTPYHFGSEERVNRCAQDLVDDVGLPSDTEFSTHLQYLCYSSCQQYLSGNLEESDLWTGVSLLQSQNELKTVITKMLPKYFSSKHKQEALEYVLDHFREAWKETKTFETKIQFTQIDSRNCDKEKLMNLLTSCKTHKLVETVMNLYLSNLCIELYPLKDPTVTTPKSLLFAFINITTPAPWSKSNDDVTLNFEWGTSSRSNRRQSDFSNNSKTNWGYTSTSTPKSRGNFAKIF